MRAVLVALVVAACVAVSVDAHAKLTSPVPWNAQPSKTNPCGGGAATAVQATYAPGATIKLGWTVVAGDGNGPVTVSWDKNGGTTFTNPTVAASSPADPIVNTGPYTLTVTIPDGIVGDKVTLQAKSSTNWYACATVAVKAATSPTGGSQGSVASSTGAAGSADTQVCRPAPSALPFCTGLTGEIEISSSPALQNMGDVDTALKGVYLFNINSTKVFQHASTSGCADAYKKYVCANEFPLCGTAAKGGGCRSQCFKFAELCGLDDSHASLYPCNDNQVLEKDSMGTCEACNGACALGLNGASSSAAPLSALALLVAAVAAAVAARRA